MKIPMTTKQCDGAREGRWPIEVEPMSRNPEGRGSIPRLGSRRSSLISIEHAELPRSTPSLVLCCAWLVTMALHACAMHIAHCGLGQLVSPVTNFWGWRMSSSYRHCGRAKRSRIISDTRRLRSSLQFRYINAQNESLRSLVAAERA